MPITIENFRKTASSEQLMVLEGIIVLGKREHHLATKVNDAHSPFKRAADIERTYWGFQLTQIADLVIDQEIAPSGNRAAAPYQRKLDEVREKIAYLFQVATNELGMENLGFVQRNFHHYVGEPLSPSR